MKLFFKFACIVLFSVPFLVHAESIDSFQSQIYLREDGSLDVTEWITYDFEENERHGIFRTIPLTHPSGDPDLFHERYIDIEVGDVLLDQANVPFEVSEEEREIEIKIGDPDTTITGSHLYEINYHVHGALQYFEDGSVDLNWNVTGNGWNVPIESVVARVPDPEGLYLEAASCYQGESGATETCEIATSTSFIDFRAAYVGPGEGLTIARAVDGRKVAHQELVRFNAVPIVIALALVWFAGLAVFTYKERTKHKTKRAIIAEYEPYENIPPMYSGLLFDGALDSRDIAAGIVYLAKEGFIQIKKTDRKALFLFEVDDYVFTLKKEISLAEGAFAPEILKLIFRDGDAAVGTVVSLHELARSMERKRANSVLLRSLTQSASRDLVANGYFENNWRRLLTCILIAAAASLIAAIFVHIFALFFFILSAGILLLAVKRRARKGYEALDHLKGFKLFLSVTDKERFAFHNAPEKSPEQFMEYLPYAIAFGVEKKWAEVFKDIIIPDPEWYDGGGAAHFSAVSFAQSVSAFSTAFASSSGASASAGGGSSGGGAGGGGGGSW